MIFDKTLPPECYREDRPIEPAGLVVHYISVNVGHPQLRPDLEEWQRFDPNTIHAFLVDLNRPGFERGRVWRVEPDTPRAYGSYHYLIARDGTTFRLAPFGRYVYHAGYSRWRQRDSLNWWTGGVALAGPGEDVAYTPNQYAALADLAIGHDFGPRSLAGHERVRAAWNRRYPKKAAAPKHDPGPRFDWKKLKQEIISRAT